MTEQLTLKQRFGDAPQTDADQRRARALAQSVDQPGEMRLARPRLPQYEHRVRPPRRPPREPDHVPRQRVGLSIDGTRPCSRHSISRSRVRRIASEETPLSRPAIPQEARATAASVRDCRIELICEGKPIGVPTSKRIRITRIPA